MALSLNFEAIKYFFTARFIDPSLMIPHFLVNNINLISPEKLKEYGFKGVVFDKDNTLTEPLVNEVHPSVKNALSHYKDVFWDNLAIMSDYAGTKDDKNYKSAVEVEWNLGIKVIKHNRKKPSGIESVIDYFKCDTSELVCIGDRILTDIVFGNFGGMLTVYTEPVTDKESTKIASRIRRYEIRLMEKFMDQGIKAPEHERYNADICLKRLN